MSDIPEPPHDDPESYLGLSVGRAEEVARERGWTTVRVVPPNALITLEYLVGRINFAAEGDRVVRCWTG